MSDRDDLARLLEQHPAYSTGNDQQDLFKAREAADAILAAGWVSPQRWREDRLEGERHVTDLMATVAQLGPEREALAATVERVTALCDEVERVGRKPDWSVSTARIRRALAPESSP